MAKRNLDSFKEGDIPDLTGKVIIVTGGLHFIPAESWKTDNGTRDQWDWEDNL